MFEFPQWTLLYWPWVLGLLLLLLLPRFVNSYRRHKALPPGPRGLPIVGNVLQVSPQRPWLDFERWAQEFGPIFSLNLAGQTIIVLNTFKAASDLLDRRSSIYSDRPQHIMAGEILTGGIAVLFMQNGSRLRRVRRAAHEGFNIRAVAKYHSVMAKEAALATLRMSKDSEAWQAHVSRAAASVIINATYGKPSLTDDDDSFVKKNHALGKRITEAIIPLSYMVDVIPPLKYVPAGIAKWKREGLEWYKETTKMLRGFVRDVEDEMREGHPSRCFTADLIENKARHGLTDDEGAWLAGLLFLAGAETTTQALFYFVQAMLLYPEVMRKAQFEIDEVVGRERPPSFDDQKNLPYIEAMIKEVLRWRTPAPMSVPHRVSEDDWYEGYLIPKGATVITNVWTMHKDESLFPDHDEFKPERFLSGTPHDTHGIGNASFGFGRRLCVGMNFANQMLFISIATILWALNIEAPLDEYGKPVLPDKDAFEEAGTTLFVITFFCTVIIFTITTTGRGPAPFRCKISLRFPDALPILQKA
ncbi:hypothetical protein CVT26_001710 [Gymnopilus dilepis]|uniref:Cytochrome P450 n=1 Tax=Gymnopilus dilepis TaxID=231916 RepID=A0A409VR77_9AGAR|nr:hypothetical protein CVT26_001710 [Gymnopilus dilepis]